MQNFSIAWTDEMLYNKYELTDGEINFIESMIKPMELGGDSVLYRIVYQASAMYPDDGSFTDRDIHRVLKRKQISGMGSE